MTSFRDRIKALREELRASENLAERWATSRPSEIKASDRTYHRGQANMARAYGQMLDKILEES